MTMQQLYLLVPLAPLAAAAAVGLFGPRLGRGLSHWLCILGVASAFVGLAISRFKRSHPDAPDAPATPPATSS